MTPQGLVDELERLEDDLRLLIPVLRRQLADQAAEGFARPREIFVVGQGDSYIAGVAAEMAFFAEGLSVRTQHAQHFRDYAIDGMRSPEHTLVVGVSASGATERVVQALVAARDRGAATLAVTGRAGSAAAAAADRDLLVELSEKERSPGIRSYQASLAALLMAASTLGGSDVPAAKFEALPSAVGATVRAALACCPAIAASVADAPTIMFAGTGPSYGAALYAAAKLVEAAGVTASGHELEDWWHVDRFKTPSDLPLVVIAPPGRSNLRALELARKAREIGRRVIVVASRADTALARYADAVIPVCGEAPEELSPLLYHICGGALAAALASRLGRNPFGFRPAFT